MAVNPRFSVFSLLLLFGSCVDSTVHGRESKFFSKVTTKPTVEYAPAPAPGPAIAPTSMQVETGYGLYGSESDSNKEMTNNYENEVTLTGSSSNMNDEMLNDESLDDQETGSFDDYKTASKGAYDRIPRGTGMSDTRYMEGGKYYYDIKSDTTRDQTLDPQVYEFNTMEEYYQSQEYQNNKEEYVP